MKEKLYKTNHKRGYYRMRQFLMLSFVLISAAITISVPTYIAMNNSKEAISSKAEEINQENLETYEEDASNQDA